MRADCLCTKVVNRSTTSTSFPFIVCSGAPTASTAIFYSKVLLFISLQSPPPTHTDDALLLTRLLLTATEAAEVEEAVKHQHWLFMQHGQSRMASLCTAPKNSPHNSFTRFDEINQMQSERERVSRCKRIAKTEQLRATTESTGGGGSLPLTPPLNLLSQKAPLQEGSLLQQ